MKKIITLTAVALLGLQANAQMGMQGTWMLGANLGTSSTGTATISSYKTTYTKALPSVSYFISPSTAIGVQFGIDNVKQTQTGVNDITDNTFAVAPMVRHYWNLKGRFYFFGEANLPLAFGNSKNGSTTLSKSTSIDLNLNPGFQYFITKWFSVETSANLFNFNTTSSKPTGGTSSSNSSVAFMTDQTAIGNMNVGFKFLFR